jgi:hypothetical protein
VAPGAPLAVGCGAALYFLRKKNLPLPRAAALGAAGLVAGTMLGTAVQGARPRAAERACRNKKALKRRVGERPLTDSRVCASPRPAQHAGALRVDIVPLGLLNSPATLVSEFALTGLFAVRCAARAICAICACGATRHAFLPSLRLPAAAC